MTTPTAVAADPVRRDRLRKVAFVSVSVIIAALLAWALGSSTLGRGAAVAAIVNEDKPVTVQGQLVPLGRQLAGLLVDGSDEQFHWVLTSAADARRGIANGDYTAVVTVPPTFSERATAAAASNDAAKAAQGSVTVTTSRDSAVTDVAVARRVVQAATTTLNTQVVETYLDNVYVGFNTLHTELGKAATGADQLADGTKQADTGAKQLADGAEQLGDGTGRLATGAKQLADGLSDARRQTSDLPAQTRKLADGARQVADGNQQIADAVVPVANAALVGIDALPRFGTSVDELAQLVDDCPRLLYRDFCERLSQTSAKVTTRSNQLTTRSSGIRGQVVQVRDGVTRLADGSDRVADGAEQLAAAAPKLTTGLAQAATGAEQLSDGVTQVDTGAHQLADGGRQLSTGVSQVNGGMTTLARGLSGALTQIPTFTPAERTQLAKSVATPTLVSGGSTATSRLAGSLFLVLALWIGALAVFAAWPPTPTDRGSTLASASSTWRLTADAARPGLVVAAAVGVVLGIGSAVHLGLPFWRSLGLVTVAVLVAVVFALVNQALLAALGNAGRLAALAALGVTAIVGISSSSATLTTVAALLPTQEAGTAFRAVTMGGPGLFGALAALALWAGIAAVTTAWMIERQRTASPRLLRLTTAGASLVTPV